MDERERANQCFLTAIELFRGEIDSETWAGQLYLRPGENGTWDVFKREQASDGEIEIYTDTIYPSEFGSAQILGAYLKRLHERDHENVDLPQPGAHRGELIE
jgi:hypothetical protein